MTLYPLNHQLTLGTLSLRVLRQAQHRLREATSPLALTARAIPGINRLRPTA